MFVRNKQGGFDIDPQMLGIGCLNVIYQRGVLGQALLKWIGYMYHPKSTFRTYKNSEKSKYIIESAFPVEHLEWHYVPEDDKELDLAIEWYKNHVRKNGNPLWHSVQAIKEAIYNTNQKMMDVQSSANELKTAQELLKTLPVSLKKMEQQAEQEDMIEDDNIAGDRDIKKGEKLPANAKR